MPDRKTILILLRLCGALSTAALTVASPHAFAQSTDVEQLTVITKPSKGHPETASYTVGYADLDLKTEAGRKELNNRIRISADYVCKKVNENNNVCRGAAVSDAMVLARAAEHQIRVHGVTPPAGAAWVPPPGR